MSYGNFTALDSNGYNDGFEGRVAANSAAIISGDALTVSGEFVTLSSAGDTIIGVAANQTTFASDNQTVARAKCLYAPIRSTDVYSIPILGGTITTADINKYYDITSTQVVDGTTENTTTGQLLMVDLILAPSGATMGMGKFKIVNL